jgi:hypothetical protein
MNDQEAQATMKNYLAYIRKHGDEKVGAINKQADEEFFA